MAAVPLDFIDQTSLIGPPERIAERLHAYAEAGVTTLNVTTFAADARGAGRDPAHGRRGHGRHRI